MSRTVPSADVVATLVLRTSYQLTLLWFALAHVAAAALALALLWWHQVLPQEVPETALGWLKSPNAAAIGVTGLAVLGAYGAAIRWLFLRTEKLARRYLLGGL